MGTQIESRFSRVAILNQDSRVLVIMGFNGLWNLPGGKCETGESYEDAAKRELFEELGVNLEIVELAEMNVEVGGVKWTGRLFLGVEMFGTPTIKEPDKVQQLSYVPVSSICTLPALPGALGESIQKAIERGKVEWENR